MRRNTYFLTKPNIVQSFVEGDKEAGLTLLNPLCLRKALLPRVPIEGIEGTLWSIFHVAKNMSVNHGCLNVLVAEKALNLSDVDAVHQKMRRKAMPEGMDGRMFHCGKEGSPEIRAKFCLRSFLQNY